MPETNKIGGRSLWKEVNHLWSIRLCATVKGANQRFRTPCVLCVVGGVGAAVDTSAGGARDTDAVHDLARATSDVLGLQLLQRNMSLQRALKQLRKELDRHVCVYALNAFSTKNRESVGVGFCHTFNMSSPKQSNTHTDRLRACCHNAFSTKNR